MTAEQYNLLIQFATDFQSSVLAYEDEHGIIDLNTSPISDIVTAGANMMHLINSLEPIHSPENCDPF